MPSFSLPPITRLSIRRNVSKNLRVKSMVASPFRKSISILLLSTSTTSFSISRISPSSKTIQSQPVRNPTFLSVSNNNPWKSLMNSLSSSTFPSKNEKLDEQISSLTIASWEEIRTKLEAQDASFKDFRSNLEYGYGPASPLHNLRLFDPSTKESDVRVTFYRDSASWCPYCQKVWMMLEEKRIPYRVKRVNMRCYGEKPLEFRMIQPSGNIPVAEIDGVLYTQSNDIMVALERSFGERNLTPIDGGKARELLQLERQLFSAWMYWLTGSSRAKASFQSVLQTVENELKEQNSIPNSKGFFMGDDVTYVDFMYAPFLERMAASLLYYKAFIIRYPKHLAGSCPYPNINKWFDAMETLESYIVTKSDYYTHVWDLPPQLGGCVTEDDRYQDSINGKRENSWSIPLNPHNYDLEPDWECCKQARLDVVERLSFNHENIVNFAARGAGKQGFPSYSAPLADPNATSNDTVKSSVDGILRIIATLLLEDESVDRAIPKNEKLLNEMEDLVGVIKSNGDGLVNDVVDSLVYLRDRVGVPRDMRLPGARLLRAYLNWSIGYF